MKICMSSKDELDEKIVRIELALNTLMLYNKTVSTVI